MKPFSARVLLAAVFIARGTSFLFSKQLLTNLSPMSILAVRFLLAFLVLALIFNKKIRQLDHKSLKGGIILGLLYTVCMIFKMYGLRLIDSGVSSLIENMAILFVPLYVAVLTKKIPKIKTIICALLAIIGVAFLSLTQFEKSNGALGIVLMICAALTYADCILVTEKVSKDCDAPFVLSSTLLSCNHLSCKCQSNSYNHAQCSIKNCKPDMSCLNEGFCF